jgi:acyl transferase domain-containing protein
MRSAARCRVPAARLSYVEAHGAKRLGDPIELNALKEVLLEGRSPDHFCWIGSVKTNIGHLEAAGGIAGLIKVVLALQRRQIPANLHFQELNLHICLADTPLRIPSALQLWLANEPRVAGVSALGSGGTNAHVIVEEAPAPVVPAAGIAPEPVASPGSLSEECRSLATGGLPALLLGSILRRLLGPTLSANVGRSHFDCWPLSAIRSKAAALPKSADQVPGRAYFGDG